MASTYPIIEVDGNLAGDLEQLGSKRKFWYQRLEHDDEWWLFKADDRIAGGTETIGTGEDWAEKIVCEICQLLGIPHVHYELAVETNTGVPGVVCRNVASATADLVLGNQLMLEHDPSYPSDEGRKYGVREHTVGAVADAIAKLQAPPPKFCQGVPDGVQSASEIFVAYVMLDTLVANQDRHHENWGALGTTEPRLAPTFDHGAALARNEPDAKRHRRLYGPDPNYNMENFAAKARSSFYATAEAKRPLKTLDAFVLFAERDPVAADSWLARLKALPLREVESVIARIPEGRMTALSREFTLELLQANTRRLLSR